MENLIKEENNSVVVNSTEIVHEECVEKVSCDTTKNHGTRRKYVKTEQVHEVPQSKPLVQLFSLLYAYTYFLNLRWSKSLSIGYCPDTFQLKILLNDSRSDGRIILSQFEWGGLYHLLQKIMKMVQSANNELNEILTGLKTGVNSYSKQRVKVSPNFSLVIEQNLKEVVIIFNHYLNGHRNCISLSYYEWCKLYANIEFLNTMVEQLRHSTIVVIAYFEQYVHRCVESVSETTDFFVPLGFSPAEIEKYARLFYEFPVLCKDNLQRLIQIEKRMRGISNELSTNL